MEQQHVQRKKEMEVEDDSISPQAGGGGGCCIELDPEPVLRLHLNELSHPGTSLFLSVVDGSRLLSNAINHVVQHLYASGDSSNDNSGIKNSNPPSPPTPKIHIPPSRSVTLILRSMDGVAYTTGLQIDSQHKEIHFSLDYIRAAGSGNSLLRRHEIIGVVTHEMVHCYQYDALGTAPGGLIEGIADFVRLKAGLAPPHWQRPSKSGGGVADGDRWDSGYQRTAYFLEWLEGEFGEGSVRRINQAMRKERYEEGRFWEGIFGEGVCVQGLWKRYCASFEEEDCRRERAVGGKCCGITGEPVPESSGKEDKQVDSVAGKSCSPDEEEAEEDGNNDDDDDEDDEVVLVELDEGKDSARAARGEEPRVALPFVATKLPS